MQQPSRLEQRRTFYHRLFTFINRFMVLQWRLGLGRLVNIWPKGIGRIMILVHHGRKSGQTYFAPINYAPINHEIYCCAGFGERTDWYQNLLVHPQIDIWLPGQRLRGISHDISDHPDRVKLLRQVLLASGFAATTFGDVNPRRASDQDLGQMTHTYRLIAIDHLEPAEGPGGPGEWVWMTWLALITFIGLIVGVLLMLQH